MNTSKWLAAGVAMGMAWAAGPGGAAPTIAHDPITVAERGKPLGVRATVRDAGARVEGAWLHYSTSRGATPFRAAMASSGAGTWFATIPGHLVGPGPELQYYVQAENADGESSETEWFKVRVVDSGVPPEAIPAASDVARQAQRQAQEAARPAPAPPPAPPRSTRHRYLVPAAVIAGGAVAVGGAYAIVEKNSGGSGGGGGGGTW